MATDTANIYVARETFICEIGGIQYHVTKGERVRVGHPLLDQQRGSFVPVDVSVTYDLPVVEQATAAPGEKRGLARRPT